MSKLAYVPVILETPFMGKGETEKQRRDDAARKLLYLRACMRDCLLSGEAPFASHGLYTQPGVLRDDVPLERAAGIEAGFEAGFAFRAMATRTVVYTDLGISSGMQAGIDHARALAETRGVPVESVLHQRTLGPDWEADANLRARPADRRSSHLADLFGEVEGFVDLVYADRPAADDGYVYTLRIDAGVEAYHHDEPLLGFRVDLRKRFGL